MQKTHHIYATDMDVIKEQKKNGETAGAYACNAGTKIISSRVSYRKVRGILRHTAEKQEKQGILLFGTGNTDFYYICEHVTIQEIFGRLEHDHTNTFLRIRARY